MGTLRALVAAANPGDTIIFTNNLSGQTILLTNGQITLAQNVTIDGSALASPVQINGNAQSRIFYINSGVTATNNSLVITNGNAPDGSGIHNSGGNLTMNHCTINGNTNFGGGVDGHGAGIYNSSGSALALNYCTLANNTSAGANDFGGGVFNNGTLTANNCTVTNNSSVASPGDAYGGGIYNDSGGTLTLNNCTFANNSSTGNNAYGGGVGNTGVMAANNCTLANNNSVGSPFDGHGGGFYNEGTLTVNNCTLASNSCSGNNGYGGGIDDRFPSSRLNLTNSIICSNTATTSGQNLYNEGTLNVGTSLVDTDALLVGLGSYGGPTMTMPPLPGSPAINAGSDSVTNFLATDQRGFPREVGAHVDIGAVEFQLAPPISSPSPPTMMTPTGLMSAGCLCVKPCFMPRTTPRLPLTQAFPARPSC